MNLCFKKVKFILKNDKGFTLIELLLVISIFSILSVPMVSLFRSSININNILTDKCLKLEHARLAMDFIQIQINLSDEYKLVSNRELHLKNGKDIVIFKFDNIGKRLIFANNVIAENLNDFSIKLNDDIINIKIKMKSVNSLSFLELIGQFSVKYKTQY